MEVHHHAHTSRRKWTHYFWEFLMLFLAVFCGFLAENKREHMIENSRARTLARNLYKEVLTDSITIAQFIANRSLKEKECRYFIDYVKDSNLVNPSGRFFPAFTTAFIQTQYIIFEPNDGILNQLRNSGELRYFKNADLQAALGKLSVKIADIRTRNEREYSYVEFYNRPFILKYFDFNWYETITKYGARTLVESLKSSEAASNKGKLANEEKFSRQEASHLASYYLLMLRSTRQIQYKEYVDANQRVLELLKKEYHLE